MSSESVIYLGLAGVVFAVIGWGIWIGSFLPQPFGAAFAAALFVAGVFIFIACWREDA